MLEEVAVLHLDHGIDQHAGQFPKRHQLAARLHGRLDLADHLALEREPGQGRTVRVRDPRDAPPLVQAHHHPVYGTRLALAEPEMERVGGPQVLAPTREGLHFGVARARGLRCVGGPIAETLQARQQIETLDVESALEYQRSRMDPGRGLEQAALKARLDRAIEAQREPNAHGQRRNHRSGQPPPDHAEPHARKKLGDGSGPREGPGRPGSEACKR